jgi:hypothetical protein
MTERMNIRRMQVPERSSEEPGAPFDAEKDISTEVWRDIFNQCEEGKRQSPLRAADCLSKISLLNPNKPLSISQSDWAAIHEEFAREVQHASTIELLKLNAPLRILDPSPVTALTPHETQLATARSEELLQKHSFFNDDYLFIQNLALSNRDLISEAVAQKMSADCRSHFQLCRDLGLPETLAFYMSIVKLLDADARDSMIDKDWQGARKKWKEEAGRGVHSVLETQVLLNLALNFQLAAAERIEREDGKLKITKPDRKSQISREKDVPMPEQISI